MGFAAHLRYHWMENVVYSTLQYIPLALIGIGLNDFFVIHLFALIVGHHNHSNLHLPEWVKGLGFGALIGVFIALVVLGTNLSGSVVIIGFTMLFFFLLSPVLKYVFNSPEMHIWHHAYHLPEEHRNGVNFGLSLSCWDYIFGTNYIPHSGRDIPLGFPGKEEFPEDFIHQVTYLGRQQPTPKDATILDS
jgi:sterol desaturase/sphingolipid hydroxylase (fatty acid hydroxylase superfamily)